MGDRPVVVAMGGSSLEREVSLRGGHRVERALRELGYEVLGLDVDARFIDAVQEVDPEFVFVAMHGRGGEDGTLQELLETLSIPYTGSDALASALCMDKVLFKRVLSEHGVPTPAFHSFSEVAFREMGAAGTFPRVLEELGLPVVVKPVAQGSAIGIKFVETAEQFPSAILGAFGYGDRVLVEERIVGRELAVTVLDRPGEAYGRDGSERAGCVGGGASGSSGGEAGAGAEKSSGGEAGAGAEKSSGGEAGAGTRGRRRTDPGPVALPIVELVTPEGFFSYEAHYTIGALRLEVPAQLPAEVAAKVEEAALESYRLMGCRDFARVDMILDGEEVPRVLEINTIPGLTETGITPAAAEAAGIHFTELVEAIVARVAGGLGGLGGSDIEQSR